MAITNGNVEGENGNGDKVLFAVLAIAIIALAIFQSQSPETYYTMFYVVVALVVIFLLIHYRWGRKRWA